MVQVTGQRVGRGDDELSTTAWELLAARPT
jgi:hypothetical protein